MIIIRDSVIMLGTMAMLWGFTAFCFVDMSSDKLPVDILKYTSNQ